MEDYTFNAVHIFPVVASLPKCYIIRLWTYTQKYGRMIAVWKNLAGGKGWQVNLGAAATLFALYSI
jgi:hypothetical protein